MFSILYVDDELALLEIGKLFLEQSGLFSVDTVTSASDALQVIAGKRYDAIISDYQMPEMDGIEFLKQVRASGNTVPFIIFTGRGREEIVIQALNEGADFYLQKGGEPVSQFAELEHKVHMAVMQRKAEASIRDHERREADIINFLPDATFAIDTNGVVIAWNRAMEKMTGVKSTEILGKDNYEYAIPFYHERRPILINLVLKDDPVTAAKYPVITRDGTTLFSEITIPHFNDGRGAALWFTASPLYDTRGTIVGAIESIREITERKHAEEALNESERRFRELSNLLPQVIFETDVKGNLTYANRIAFERFGYTEDELRQGLDFLQMIASNDRKRAMEDFHSMLGQKERTGSAGEYQGLRKDGKTFPISIYSSPIIVNDRIIGLRGIIVDITERKKAENDLKNTIAFLNSLIDQSPTPMWISDEKGLLILINKACLDLLHIDEADVVGKYSIFEDTHILEQGFLPNVRNVFENGIVARFQLKYDTKQLKSLHLEKFVTLFLDVTIFPVRDTSGKITNAVIQHTNITQRRKAEDALRESEEKYRTVFETTGTATVLIENDGTISLANSEFERLCGYRKSEIENRKKWMEFVIKEDLDRMLVQHQLRRINGQRALPQYEFRFISKSGDVRNIFLTIDIIPGTTKSVASLLDITERKKVEDSLVAANREYTNLLNQIQEAYYRSDSEGRLIRGSRSFATLLGYSDISECLGRIIAEDFYFNPDDRKQFLETIYIDGKVTDYEVLLKRKDNTPVLVSTSSHVYRDPAGKVIGIEGTFHDITERKRIEKELRDSEEKYRNVVEDQTEIISRFLPDGTHVFVNEAYCRYFGLRREDILGHRFRPTLPDEDKERMKLFFSSLSPENPVGIIEHRIIMPDRRILWQRWSDRAIFNASGEITEYQSVGRDVTEKKEAEEALRESEDRLRMIMQSIQTGIVIIDAATHTILDANPKALAMIEAEKGTVIGSVCHRFFCPCDEGQCPVSDRGMQVDSSERILVTSGGEQIPVLKTIIPATINGKKVFVESFSDITELKSKEDRIRILAGLLDLIPASVTVHDSEGRFLYANAKTFKCHGYTEEEFYRMTLHELDVPESEKLLDDRIRRLDEIGELSCEVGHFRKDRSVLPLLITAKKTEWDGCPVILSIATDNTERRAMENKIKEREEQLELALWSADEGVIDVDLVTGILMVNSTASSILGYRMEEFPKTADAFLAIIHPDDLAEGNRQFSDLLAGTISSFDYEERIKTVSGEWCWILARGKVVARDEKGKPLRYIGTHRDISKRKQAEEKLKASDARFVALFNASPVPILLTDADDGRLLSVNDAAVSLFGYEKEEMLEKTTVGLGIWVTPEERRYQLQQLKEAGFVRNVETRIRSKSGQIYDVLFNSDATDFGGKSAIITVIYDITDRKRAEEERVTACHEYQTLLDQIQDVYYRSDTDGRLIRGSRSLARMVGYNEISEVIGKNIAQEFYANPADRKRLLEEIYRNGKVTNYEVYLKKKDGSPLLISASSHLFYNPDGTIGGIEGTFRDITEQKRAERTIQETNKKINLLTSITRHDVANQVATLRGFAKIAMMKKPDPVIIDLLKKIDTAGATIARQIEFTKAYQDLGIHAPFWHGIREIIARQQSDTISLSCTCDAEVFADPMLEKVFFNLIENAARHGERVTTITISCREVSEGIRIAVEDNGTGVPTELKEKIFEKGYGKHTGFGLFLAREILAITGIAICETGEPRKGARFEITVPKGFYRITAAR